jgi:hypothetical protein
MIDQLRFHDAEKRLSHGIIPTVPLARHALDESMRAQLRAKAESLNFSIALLSQSIG